MLRYSPSSYDADLHLKPPLLLWIAVLYLSRVIVLPIVTGFSTMLGINTDALAFLPRHFSPGLLISSLSAAVVLYAMCRRRSAGSKPVRWLWAHGRVLLAITAVADCFLSLLTTSNWWNATSDQLPVPLLIAMLDAYFFLYILAARRVRDTFAENTVDGAVERVGGNPGNGLL
jgi:drug/metabolite transporter (DMT)-like permease